MPLFLQASSGTFTMIVPFIGCDGISPAGRARVTTMVDAINKASQLREMRFEIRGYSAATGDQNADLASSQARADMVRSLMIAQGVDPARLVPLGFGASHADYGLVPEDAENCRVELAVAR